uniref:Uncharacterized protein n=1 Tax=Arundo donax TaxID=35708 RepID=A0A0A8ZK21_ARUDO
MLRDWNAIQGLCGNRNFNHDDVIDFPPFVQFT